MPPRDDEDEKKGKTISSGRPKATPTPAKKGLGSLGGTAKKPTGRVLSEADVTTRPATTKIERRPNESDASFTKRRNEAKRARSATSGAATAKRPGSAERKGTAAGAAALLKRNAKPTTEAPARSGLGALGSKPTPTPTPKEKRKKKVSRRSRRRFGRSSPRRA